MKKQKTSLGRGLNDIFSENSIDIELDERLAVIVPLADVEPNKNQPRKFFDKESLSDLAASIGEHGLLQPIIVRKIGDSVKERYQIISGERRWRASRMAGIQEIPVIIKDLNDKEVLEIGLIENLQREDLNAVEEARGYKKLIDEHGLTQEEISKQVKKSRPVISNALRILSLPDEILEFVLAGKLSSGHARAMLPLMDFYPPEKLLSLANDVIKKDLTVREIENIAKHIKAVRNSKKADKTKKKESPEMIYFHEIEDDISKAWGRKVKILPPKTNGKSRKGAKVGTVVLEFYDGEDFNALAEKLLGKE